MGFEKAYQQQGPLLLSDKERRESSILLVEPEPSLRNSMRQLLLSQGYGYVADSGTHLQALTKFEERPITHVIFEAQKTTMPAREFLSKILEYDKNIIAIPSSWEPSLDDVFSLLIGGARGFVVKPFTDDSLDQALVMATKGEPISEAILHAKDRNEALAALLMTAVDKLAVTLRQSAQFETAKREIPKRLLGLKRASELGFTFAQGGEEQLLDAITNFCIDRSNGPATRLGRLRKRHDDKRKSNVGKKTEGSDGKVTEAA